MKKITLLLAVMAIAFSAFADEAITEQPAGTLKNYSRTGQAVIDDYYDGYFVAYQEGKMSIVFADDGETVYLKDPVFGLEYDSWVKGTINSEGNLIKVPLGQVLYHSPYYDADIILMWGTTSSAYITEDWELGIDFTPDLEKSDVVYAINGETITLTESQGAEELTGESLDEFAATGLSAIWADNHAWTRFIEWGTVLTEIPAPKPAVPANPTDLTWRDGNNEMGYSRFGFTINPVDVDGNPLATEFLSYSIFTDNDELFTFDMDHYNYDFNEETTEVPYGQYSYNFSPESVYFYRTNAEGYDPFFTWRIGIQVYYTVDGVKSASDIVYLEVFPKPETGEKTDAPSSSKENYVYNDGNLYYNAYTVNLIETEPSDIYYRIGVLTDGDYVYGEWMLYTGELNFTEEGTYMVEAYAIAENKTESDHIWDGFTVSKMVDVEELFAGKTVAGVRYYNMAGQEMAQPSGLTIMVTTYTDGTTSAAKVMK